MALVVLAACGDGATTGPPPGTDAITLDTRVHLLEADGSTALTTTLSEAEVRTLVDRVNEVWAQAGIRFARLSTGAARDESGGH